MGSDDDSDDDAVDVMAVVKPIQNKLKKQGKVIDKLDAFMKAAEKRNAEEAEARSAMTNKLEEVAAGLLGLRERIDSSPWREVRPSVPRCPSTGLPPPNSTRAPGRGQDPGGSHGAAASARVKA